MLVQHILRSGIVLSLFAVVGTALVALTYQGTRGAIAAAEREALARQLHSVISEADYNNQLLSDVVLVQSEDLLGTAKPLPAFRARKDNVPVALILNAVAPDGYNGDIKLLIGIRMDGSISGVRVLDHRETPGLGDAIETRRSNWIDGFTGKSLNDLTAKQWKVKRDGGQFDQFTGATITPRAVVKAVHKALLFFQENKDKLFGSNQQEMDPDDCELPPDKNAPPAKSSTNASEVGK